jgi:hypothetical protein
MSVDPDEVTNLNRKQLCEKLIELGYPVTQYLIKTAVERRELVPTRLGVANYFSVNDGLRWIASRRQSGIYRAPESVVFQ